MELTDYFEPVSVDADYRLGEETCFGNFVQKHLPGGNMPDWEKADIAIIGISEYRGAHMDNCTNAAGQARKCLYELSGTVKNMKIADLGDLRAGKRLEDSYAALRDVVAGLIGKRILPLVLGGSRDLVLAMFNAYEINNKTINLTAIDNRAGMGSDYYTDPDISRKSYLNNIIISKSKYLFNFTNIGYQSCFTSAGEIRLLEDLLFDGLRLGMVRENFKETEPVIRDTDLLSISMSAIRQADAPAALFPSPNGFTGEEVCQLAWYGGQSERVSCLAISDWYAGYDNRYLTAHQVAQAAWYFIDGFYKRKGEFPFNPSRECTKFIVNLSGKDNEIIFYKSNRSERWWMEVPSSKLPRSLMVACSHEDYQRACRQEVPERWWQNFKKINQ